MKVNLNNSAQVAVIAREIKNGATISNDLEVVHTWKSNFFGTLCSRFVSFITRKTPTTGTIDDVVGKILLAERGISKADGLSNAITLISVLRNNENDPNTRSEMDKLVTELKKTEKQVRSVERSLSFLNAMNVNFDNAKHVSKLFTIYMKNINNKLKNKSVERFFDSSSIHVVVAKRNKVDQLVEQRNKEGLLNKGLEIAANLKKAPSLKVLSTGVETVKRIAEKVNDENCTKLLKNFVNNNANRDHQHKLKVEAKKRKNLRKEKAKPEQERQRISNETYQEFKILENEYKEKLYKEKVEKEKVIQYKPEEKLDLQEEIVEENKGTFGKQVVIQNKFDTTEILSEEQKELEQKEFEAEILRQKEIAEQQIEKNKNKSLWNFFW